MAHYYTDNRDLKSERRKITFNYHEHVLNFQSDVGVFSKDSIDYGSRALLASFEPLKNISVLDVGCGYGAIALSLAAVGENIKCDLVDVNGRALDLAKENAGSLKLPNIEIYESFCYENVHDCFDLIVSNPPIRAGKQVVHEILSGAFDHLHIGGELRVVIQKKQGAPSAKLKMEQVFGNCQILNRDKGYYILSSVKKQERPE